jgi:hypothetical protein
VGLFNGTFEPGRENAEMVLLHVHWQTTRGSWNHGRQKEHRNFIEKLLTVNGMMVCNRSNRRQTPSTFS